jgi:hypothetical protein
MKDRGISIVESDQMSPLEFEAFCVLEQEKMRKEQEAMKNRGY